MSLPLPSTHRTVWPAIPVNHLTFPNRSLLYNAADIRLNICSPRSGRGTVPFSYFLDGGEDLLDVVFRSAACLCAAGSSRHLDAFLIHLQIPLKLQDRTHFPLKDSLAIPAAAGLVRYLIEGEFGCLGGVYACGLQ